MIIGIGVDVVDVARFARLSTRVPRLLDRVLTPPELVLANGTRRRVESLAARFAAKEALAKSLRAPADLRWHDVAVCAGAGGQPTFDLRGTVQAAMVSLGVRQLHLSLSHDAGVATAVVIAEG
jgi:holo-[acyl-carrier protein] synthase